MCARYHDPSLSGSPDIFWQGSIGLQCISRKREILQLNIYRILSKANQVIYTMDKSGQICRKRGIIPSNMHRILQTVNQIICIMYPNSIPDIMIYSQAVLKLFCWQVCLTTCQSWKREINHPNIYRILSKVNQFIYTLDTICEPNIMILAQAVLQIVCWQGSTGLQYIRRKRDTIQPNIDRNLPKVIQVIYTLDTICKPNIMILVYAVLQIFCWQGSIGLQYISQLNNHRILRKVNQVLYIMYLNCMIVALILAQAVLQIFCWQDCFTIRNAKVGKRR